MSEEREDLELQALQRQLDDAFETTRPRAGFEDELWLRMQEKRPAPSRLRDAFAGLWQGIRAVPAVPLAGVAALVVVVIGIGILGYSGFGQHSTATSSSGGGAAGFNGQEPQQLSAGSFGKLPSPTFATPTRAGGATTTNPSAPQLSPLEYAGPVQLTWNGQLNLSITSAPVFRYHEPTSTTADQFASALGAVLRSRPGGYLGSYSATDYTLEVRGTVQTPPQSPAYFIYSSPSMPPMDAAGAAPVDLASQFLAAHSLFPQWNNTTATDTSGTPTRVVFQRQFEAPGYGSAYLVNAEGERYGLEVDLNGNQITHVSGLLPVELDQASYPIVSSDAAVRAAIATGTSVPTTSTPGPSVVLTHAELVYVLVPAGDHSFYEPVFMFSGTFQMNGTTYTKHVFVPAVDPLQRRA